MILEPPLWHLGRLCERLRGLSAPDCARWAFDAAHGPLCGPAVCCWVSTAALLPRSACAGALRVQEALPVQGAQQHWRVPALHPQRPQRSRWPRCLAARAYRALFRLTNCQTSDAEVCIWHARPTGSPLTPGGCREAWTAHWPVSGPQPGFGRPVAPSSQVLLTTWGCTQVPLAGTWSPASCAAKSGPACAKPPSHVHSSRTGVCDFQGHEHHDPGTATLASCEAV